jgi:hypothetical protein
MVFVHEFPMRIVAEVLDVPEPRPVFGRGFFFESGPGMTEGTSGTADMRWRKRVMGQKMATGTGRNAGGSYETNLP